MSTTRLIDELVPLVPEGYSRSTGNRSLLRLVEQGQDELINVDQDNQVWIGTENQGYPPFLITTTGTYRYEITAANLTGVSSITHTINGTAYAVKAKRVKNIFVEMSNIDYTKKWVGKPYLYTWANPYSTITTRLYVADVPIRSYPARENQPVTVEFVEDPGSSTSKYFVTFIWEPPRLTSETIPLIVPEVYERALEEYVLGRVKQREEGGKMNEYITNFEGYWKDRFREEMRRSASIQSYRTAARPC